MKQIIIIFTLLFILNSCSTSPVSHNSTNSLPSQVNSALINAKPQLLECLKGTGLQEIVIYMNITRHGTVENVTLIPWQSIEKRQCISMIIGHLRIKNSTSKEFKIRKVIQL
jgi:hypothetical protein